MRKVFNQLYTQKTLEYTVKRNHQLEKLRLERMMHLSKEKYLIPKSLSKGLEVSTNKKKIKKNLISSTPRKYEFNLD